VLPCPTTSLEISDMNSNLFVCRPSFCRHISWWSTLSQPCIIHIPWHVEKGFSYSLPSVGPGADPGVQAVSRSAVGCHYFLPSLRLPSQPHSIAVPWPVPGYTAWWQRHIGMNNMSKVVMQLLPRVGFEPTTCWSQVLRSTRCVTAPSTMTWHFTKHYQSV